MDNKFQDNLNPDKENQMIIQIRRSDYKPITTRAREWYQKADFAVRYAIVGFIIAGLMITIGFWATILILLFTSIGYIIGKYRDRDPRLLRIITRFLRKF